MQKIQSFDWLHFKFKFSNLKQTFEFNLPVFAAKRIFKTYQHFCFLCFHSRGRFFWFHKDREITKSLFTLAKVFLPFSERKLSCTRLKLETGSPGRAVSLHLARSGSQSEHRIRRILPARGTCHIIIKCYYPDAFQLYVYYCCNAQQKCCFCFFYQVGSHLRNGKSRIYAPG